MKIILSPDSLKGSLTAKEACQCMENACRRVFPCCQILSLPGGDGGEGTLDALQSAWGKDARREHVQVSGLMGEEISVPVLICQDKAAVESAGAAALPLAGVQKDILNASSFGVGQCIDHILKEGGRKIYITLGGTGSNDGGLDLLRALGMKALDHEEKDVPRGAKGLFSLHSLDVSRMNPLLKSAEIILLTDVTNPLLGPMGATCIYGPQKGADPSLIPQLERAMAHYAGLLEKAFGVSVSGLKGAGAAGGMGAALLSAGGKCLPGADTVLDEMHFDELCRDADLVLTAEGRMDAQSVHYGKYPARVAYHAHLMGVPAIALTGGRTKDADHFHDLGQTAVLSIADGPITLEDAVKRARELMEESTFEVLQCVKIGQYICSEQKGT